MAIPTLEKTWGSANMLLNGVNSVNSSDNLLKLKNGLKNVSPGWTVKGSSDNSAFGMDDVDRWIDSGDVVFGTDAGSWIVLQNDAINTGFQLCIQARKSTNFPYPSMRLYLVVSPANGFTGGSATARPTATDEIVIFSGNAYRDNTPEYTCRLNIWMSSDGECTRVVMTETGATRCFILIDKVKNPVPGWTIPWVAAVVGYNGAARIPEYNDLNDVTTYCKSVVGTTTMPLYWTSEGWADGMMGQRLTAGNDLENNGFPLSAIGLASETVTVYGRHGELFDIWWGDDAISDGGHYPGTTPRQFVQVGDIVLPWDPTLGSAILLS